MLLKLNHILYLYSTPLIRQSTKQLEHHHQVSQQFLCYKGSSTFIFFHFIPMLEVLLHQHISIHFVIV